MKQDNSYHGAYGINNYDVRGVQFHPESVLTEYGKAIDAELAGTSVCRSVAKLYF